MKAYLVRIILTVLVGVWALDGSWAFAQQGTAALNGQVTDSSGAALAGAQVEALNTATDIPSSAVTNDAGLYNFPTLPPGTYQLSVTKEGFQKAVRPGVELHVSDVIGLNFSLRVGSVSQTVTVEGGAPLVETTSSELGGLVNDRNITELPLNGRNYIDLSLLQAGVQQNTQASLQIGGMQGTAYSANGVTIISNNYLLDGAQIGNQSGWGSASFAGTTLGVEGIKEYKVLTSAWDASYGMNMGSQMVMISKGGTNQFHGDVFEFFRNSALNARNFFDGPTVPHLEKNNFGGSFGGPIKKDKTFFFAVYEGLKETLGYTALDTVPAAGCHYESNGVTPLQPGDTVTNTQCPTLGTTASTTIPAGLAGQEVLQMLALYPIPNFTSGAGASQINQYRYGPPTFVDANYGQIRIDQTFSAADTLFGRYTVDQSSNNAANSLGQPVTSGVAFPQFRGGGTTLNQFLTLSETHIFSATVSNSARLSFSRTGWQSFWIYGDQSAAPIPSFPGGPGFSPGEPFLSFSVGGLSGPGFGGNAGPPFHPALHLQNIYSFGDDVYWSRGKHQLRFGTLINRFNQALTITSSNDWGAPTYASFSGFLSGAPSSFIGNSGGNDNRFWIYNTYGFYAQDDWHATSRLTFNLGLRYEFVSPLRELNGKSSAIQNPGSDATWTQGPVIRDRTYLNFSPRFGFAWDIFGDGKTALRGGGGVYYDIGNYGGSMTGQAITSLPNVALSLTNPSNSVFTFPHPVPTVAQLLSNGTALNESQTFDYNADNPYVYQYNLTVQRQLPKNMAISVAYVGTRGEHLWQLQEGNPIPPTAIVNGLQYWNITNPNCQAGTFSGVTGTFLKPTCRANPNWGTMVLDSTDGISLYNALQVVVKKRLTSGLEAQATYTFAHALSSSIGTLAGESCVTGMDAGVSNTEDKTDYGPACTDVRHNLEFNLLYHFPNIKAGGILGKVANGWWMGNIVAVQTGLPFTPYISTNRSNSGNRGTGVDRPNVNTQTITQGEVLQDALGNSYAAAANFVPYNPNTVIVGSPTEWFNPNMFSLQPVVPCPGVAGQNCNTLGNVGRGILPGPGLGNWNLSLVKDTAFPLLGEQGSVQFRAEFFNILNRANFADPTAAAIFSGISGVTPAKLYGAYSQAPIASGATLGTTATTSRQIQFALKLIF